MSVSNAEIAMGQLRYYPSYMLITQGWPKQYHGTNDNFGSRQRQRKQLYLGLRWTYLASDRAIQPGTNVFLVVDRDSDTLRFRYFRQRTISSRNVSIWYCFGQPCSSPTLSYGKTCVAFIDILVVPSPFLNVCLH